MTHDNEWTHNAESGADSIARIASDSVVVVPLFAGRVRAKEQSDVKRINQYDFYDLGAKLRALRTLIEGGRSPLISAWRPINDAGDALWNLLSGVTFGLHPVRLTAS